MTAESQNALITLAQRVTEAETRLADLTVALPSAAFDAATEQTDAAKLRLDSLESDIADAKRTLATAKLALAEGQRRDQAGSAAARRALRMTQLEQFRLHLARREKATRVLSKALKRAAEAYSAFFEESRAAAGSVPQGCSWPQFAHLDVKALASYEMARVSSYGKPSSLPGAGIPSMHFANQPQNLPTLVEHVAKSNAFVLGSIEASLQRLDGVQQQPNPFQPPARKSHPLAAPAE